MKSQSRRLKTRKRRSRKFKVDPTCWGKNKPLEQLWRDLSSYLSAVIIYKGSIPYEIIQLHHSDPLSSEHVYSQLRVYESNPDVVAILTAHPDAKNEYEALLYPKAKDKSVDYVINNYTKFFKRAPEYIQQHLTKHPLKKVMIPH